MTFPAAADNFVGGIPLATVQSGNVTGDLWFDATPPLWAGQGTSDIVKTFRLPATAPGNITWARLYISAYSGHMQQDKQPYIDIISRWDGDGIGGYEQVWNEPGHALFQYVNDTAGNPVGNDNTAFGGGRYDPFKIINVTENRVTSDYLVWYDVKDLIQNQTIFVNVKTAGCFDGRTKLATLVVAYDDPASATLTRYWVNAGHEALTYYTETQGDYVSPDKHVAVGETKFATGGIGSYASATLTANYMASHVGLFAFPTATVATNNHGNYWSAEDPGVCVNATYIDGIDPVSNYYRATPNFLNCGDPYECTCLDGNWTSPVFVGPTSGSYYDPTGRLVGPPIMPEIEFATPLPTGTDVQGPYSGIMHWDVTDRINTHSDSVLAYSRDVTQTGLSAFFKIPLAFLVVKSPLPPPTAAFYANITTGTAPLVVQFNDTSDGSPVEWAWTFGDTGAGNTSAEQSPVHTFATAGTYTVNLTVANAAGSDVEEKAGYITVTGSPLIAAFTNSTPRSGTPPLTVAFNDTSVGEITGRVWDFDNDGTTDSTARNATHTYDSAGSYSVRLSVTGPYGTNSTLESGYVGVFSASGAPGAAFCATPLSGPVPHTVLFTDTSTNSPTTRVWNFGDGNSTWSTTATTFAHTYTAAGSYTVILTATNAEGSDNETKTGYITVTTSSDGSTTLSLSPRVQSFNAGETREYQVVLDSLSRGLAGYDMTVTIANASVAEITGVTYPSWAQMSKAPLVPNTSVRFGAVDTNHLIIPGAASAVLATISVRGLADGITPIGMEVGELTADYGTQISLSAVNNGTAVIGSYAGPVASFSANTTSGSVPLTVFLTDQSTGSPTSWAWDFNNDGTIDSRDQNPLVTYTTSGTFTLSLNATNEAGSDTLVKPDFISAYVGASPTPPVAAFSGTPTSGTVPFTVLFTDTSTGDPTSRVWDFGDGNATWSTTETTFAHTYTAAGSYTVTLTATNTGGSDDEAKTGYITATPVSTGPAAAFSASPTTGTVPLTVTFTDQSTGSPWYWKWDFGDGSASVTRNPIHTYTSAGSYTASLTVSADNVVWSAPATRRITVNTGDGAPGASFTVSATSGSIPLEVSFTDTSTGSPTSWAWDFENDGTTDSTEQNPSHSYSTAGTYTAKLTATNSIGSGSATKTITATSSSTPPDLTVIGIIPNLGSVSSENVFALEQNPVTLKIRNSGSGPSASTTVRLTSSDGFTGSATVSTIAAGADTTAVITDTTSRSSAGGSVTYTATVDPDNSVTESSETNNAQSSSFGVKYNGYKGTRYWSGKGDVITKHTFDLKGGLVFSRGDSVYRSGSFGDGGWLSYTVNWDDSDLEIPDDATVKAAYLYVPYTWDNDLIAPDHTFIDFNGNRISRSAWYSDKSNFGTYSDYAYGLLAYDVTSKFKKNEANSAVFTRENPDYSDPAQAAVYTKLSMYEFYLVVVYEDDDKTEKQIFINEGFDLLGASAAYGTNPTEATAYIPFTGMTIKTDEMTDAMLITFVPSGDSDEGNLLYNGNVLASNVWAYGGSGTGVDGVPQIAVDERHVQSSLSDTSNTFAIQSTDLGETATPCMAAAHQILIVDLGGTLSSSTSDTTSSSTSSTLSSTKETVSSLSTTSGSVTAKGTQGTSPLSPSGTNSVPDTGGVRTMLAPSGPSAGEILDDLPAGSPVNQETGGDFHPVALMGGMAVIGATGVFAYRNGWLQNGNGGNGLFKQQKVLCHDGSGTCPPPSLDVTSGTISSAPQGSAGSLLHMPRLNVPGRWPVIAGIVLVAGLILAVSFTGVLNPVTGQASGTEMPGPAFNPLPTVEDIKDLDTTNHIPDYPAGFSARNGILFVYSGSERYAISDLELRLSKGTSEVFITASSHPPATNAVNSRLSSYFEEMGNGDGTLDPGEWLMVYSDNCYDSSHSDGEPKGRVLSWQPEGSAQKVEVPVRDTIDYTLKATSSGSVLQQGTLPFVPP